MAFQKLAEEQLSLLSDKERADYDEKLLISEERAAFLHQVEAEEDIELPEVHPVLERINLSPKKELEPIAIGEPDITVPNLLNAVEEPLTPERISVDYPIADLPTISSSYLEVREYELNVHFSDTTMVKLPPVRDYERDIPGPEKKSVPNVSIPSYQSRDFDMSQIDQPVLDDIAISGFKEIPAVKMTVEITEVKAPAVYAPQYNLPKEMNSSVSIETVPAVPVKPLITWEQAISTSLTEVPTLSLPKERSYSIDLPNAQVGELPKVAIKHSAVKSLNIQARAGKEIPVVKIRTLGSYEVSATQIENKKQQIDTVELMNSIMNINKPDISEARIAEIIGLFG